MAIVVTGMMKRSNDDDHHDEDKDDEEEEDEDEDDDGDHPRRLSPLHHALPCCRPCLCHAILGPGDDYPNYYYVDDDIRGRRRFLLVLMVHSDIAVGNGY